MVEKHDKVEKHDEVELVYKAHLFFHDTGFQINWSGSHSEIYYLLFVGVDAFKRLLQHDAVTEPFRELLLSFIEDFETLTAKLKKENDHGFQTRN